MTDRLVQAAKAHREALAAVDRAKKKLAAAREAVQVANNRVNDTTRPELAEAIVEAAQSGIKQAELVTLSGYTRERVRQICRAADVEPAE